MASRGLLGGFPLDATAECRYQLPQSIGLKALHIAAVLSIVLRRASMITPCVLSGQQTADSATAICTAVQSREAPGSIAYSRSARLQAAPNYVTSIPAEGF
jgi:hypothetical protein